MSVEIYFGWIPHHPIDEIDEEMPTVELRISDFINRNESVLPMSIGYSLSFSGLMLATVSYFIGSGSEAKHITRFAYVMIAAGASTLLGQYLDRKC